MQARSTDAQMPSYHARQTRKANTQGKHGSTQAKLRGQVPYPCVCRARRGHYRHTQRKRHATSCGCTHATGLKHPLPHRGRPPQTPMAQERSLQRRLAARGLLHPLGRLLHGFLLLHPLPRRPLCPPRGGPWRQRAQEARQEARQRVQEAR